MTKSSATLKPKRKHEATNAHLPARSAPTLRADRLSGYSAASQSPAPAPAPKSDQIIRFDPPHVSPAGNRSLAYRCGKRTLDITGALAIGVLLAPVMLLTFAILMITTGGRPIFCQQRVGFCGRTFRMFKFRTMVLNAEKIRHLVDNHHTGPIFKNQADPRITRIGRWLRSFSIDETPQLFNVLVGDMSLVGPRPPLASEVHEYEPWQRQRLAVKPGLTCLWQVAGRSEVSFEQWMHMDIWYTENQNMRTDLNLLLRTPLSVLSRRGAY